MIVDRHTVNYGPKGSIAFFVTSEDPYIKQEDGGLQIDQRRLQLFQLAVPGLDPTSAVGMSADAPEAWFGMSWTSSHEQDS